MLDVVTVPALTSRRPPSLVYNLPALGIDELKSRRDFFAHSIACISNSKHGTCGTVVFTW